ncbi:MAG TPA: Pycsar system effector family protein [Verrucomicrobiae bacterium]|nr:Pycsar system effector family protein [Verrucomicrobiae bacterium]
MFKVEKHGSYADHLMRAAQFHLVQLSSMADMKANMLLTMSSVVMTLALPQLLKNTHLWPLFILVGFCLLTICLATYAVMPKLPPSNLPAPDPSSPTFNPLFFGDFTRMSQEHFETTMGEIMSSHEKTYAAQVRELYLLGSFLAKKKYRFLRLAYISFIAGLSLTFLCFIVLALV